MVKELFDLTIGVTAHSEGILAHKTMLSIFEAAKLLKKHHISYEIIINIDRGDDATKSYFKRYKADSATSILNSDFGDLGLARNNIAKRSKGKILSFIDADDLISSNWYYALVQYLKKADIPTLVHPETSYSFGPNNEPPTIWTQHNSYDKATNSFLCSSINCWVSTIAGPREIFLKYPYPKTEHGYGNEDYGFNTETLMANIPHHVVPQTILFYRRKSTNSLLSANTSTKLVQRRTPMLDIKYFQKLDPAATKLPEFRPDLFLDVARPADHSSAYNIGSKVYQTARQVKAVGKLVTPLAYHSVNLINKVGRRRRKVSSLASDFSHTFTVCKEMSKIESILYPTKDTIANANFYAPENQIEFSLAYYRLIQPVTKLPDFVLILDVVSDAIIAKALRAISKQYSNQKIGEAHIAIICTSTNIPQGIHAPNNCDLIDFATHSDFINVANYGRLFSCLIEQLGCKRLHVFDSAYGLKWASDYATLVKDNYRLHVMLTDLESIKTSENSLMNIYEFADSISTSSPQIKKYLQEYLGFNADKISLVR